MRRNASRITQRVKANKTRMYNARGLRWPAWHMRFSLIPRTRNLMNVTTFFMSRLWGWRSALYRTVVCSKLLPLSSSNHNAKDQRMARAEVSSGIHNDCHDDFIYVVSIRNALTRRLFRAPSTFSFCSETSMEFLLASSTVTSMCLMPMYFHLKKWEKKKNNVMVALKPCF